MKNEIPYLYLSLAMILVGTYPIVAVYTTQSLPIYLSTFLSLSISTILFLPEIIKVFSKKILAPRDLFFICLQALFGTVLYRVFTLVAFRYIEPSYGVLLTALQPAFIFFLALLILKEKPHQKDILGVILAISGLCLIYLSQLSTANNSANLLLGSILIILSIICEGLFSILSKKVNPKVEPVAIAGLVTLMSCVLVAPLGIYELTRNVTEVFNLSNIFLICYTGIILTFTSYILWFKGLHKVRASEAGIFTALAPITGIISSIIIFKSQVTLLNFLGGLLIFASIFLIVFSGDLFQKQKTE